MDATLSSILQGVRLAGASKSLTSLNWITEVVEAALPEIMEQSMHEPAFTYGCHLAEAGQFFIRLLIVTAELARRVLAENSVIDSYLMQVADRLVDEPDLTTTAYLDEKDRVLKEIAAQIQSAAQSCQNLWMLSPAPPSPPQPGPELMRNAGTDTGTASSHEGAPDSFVASASPETNTSEPNARLNNVQSAADHLQAQNSSTSPPDDTPETDAQDEEVQTDAISLSRGLKHRGQGQHVCPHGASCTKGGTNEDGSLRVFLRNSAFRYSNPT